jgi:hypothetical protein
MAEIEGADEALEPDAGALVESNDDATLQSDDSPEDIETEAREMGWIPKEKYKGDPVHWRSAEEYVKRGREMLPIVRAENKKLGSEIAELKKTLKDFGEFHSRTEKRAYEAALKDLEARQSAAVEAADVEEVRAITDEIVDLKKDAKPAKDAQSADFKAAFDDWHADNAWFRTAESDTGDKAMTAVAVQVYSEQSASMSEPDKLKAVAKAVREEFPHKFENPRRREAAAVEGGVTARKGGGKGFSDLPPEAKAECDAFVKNIKGFTREKYAKSYFAAQS